ncbi:MAG: glycosyltransferase family 2 protein [Bellilinea sp.]
MKIIVLIPAYNEESSIQKVISEVPKSIKGIDTIEVLVIDDGSKDSTAQRARNAGAIVISHSTNQGVGQSFQTGLRHALSLGADILVNIDADGQFLPQEIPLLVAPILDGEADFVAANRFVDQSGNRRKPANMSNVKYLGNIIMSRLVSSLTGQRFEDVSCGFRAYSRDIMLSLNLTGTFTYTQESFLDLVFKRKRIKSVPVTILYFPDRVSRVAGNIIAYTFRTLKIIFRAYRDYKPLRFFSYIGAFPFLSGLSCLIFSGIYYLLNGEFTPYKFVGFLGIYLFSLGLLLFITGFLADMFMRIRLNQEQLLYYQKSIYYGDHLNQRIQIEEKKQES